MNHQERRNRVLRGKEFIVHEHLDDERTRRQFLEEFLDSSKRAWEIAREDVRKSREHFRDPIPEPEFFGY